MTCDEIFAAFQRYMHTTRIEMAAQVRQDVERIRPHLAPDAVTNRERGLKTDPRPASESARVAQKA